MSTASENHSANFELREVPNEREDNSLRSVHHVRLNESSLAPVDRGFGAWSFLTAAFLVEGLVWGFPNAYGVFLFKYLEDPAWASQKHAAGLLPLVGPMASGIMYAAAPLTYPVAARFPRHRRKALLLGFLLIFVSLFGASYARTVPTLLALQGVLYALGGALLYAPVVYYMSDWFVERRGLANGVIDAGTAWGGLVLPLALPPFIDKYGIAKTLRFYSIINMCVLAAILPFVRGRLPESRLTHGPVHPRSFAAHQSRLFWLKDKTFWVINMANTLQGLAYFVPLLWLPTYVSSIRLSAKDASLSLALLNAASFVGRLGLGMLSDIVSPWIIASTTLLLTSVAVFVLWGVLSYTFAGVLVFGIAYGCLAGGWTSLWAGFLRPIAKDDPTLTTSMFGCLMLFRGIGNVLSTPISTALQRNVTPGVSMSIGLAGAYRGQYEKVIVYAGTCFAASAGVVALGWLLRAQGTRR